MSEGLEIIVEMAKKGEVDTWNIDIVDLTDKYLLKIEEMKVENLKLTGKTLFYAAVLLRLKSDILEGISLEEPEDDLDHMDDSDFSQQDLSGTYTTNPIKLTRESLNTRLENILKRRSSVKLRTKRTVTLQELLKHLKKYEKLEVQQREKSIKEKISRRASYTYYTPKKIIDLAHDEFIERQINNIQQILSKLFESHETVELSELTDNGLSRAATYISLLFLASKTNITLKQDNFYSDLYIQRGVG